MQKAIKLLTTFPVTFNPLKMVSCVVMLNPLNYDWNQILTGWFKTCCGELYQSKYLALIIKVEHKQSLMNKSV